MKKDSKKFRSRLGGYNKKDVNEYIASENQRFMQFREDSQRVINDCEERISSLERLFTPCSGDGIECISHPF